MTVGVPPSLPVAGAPTGDVVEVLSCMAGPLGAACRGEASIRVTDRVETVDAVNPQIRSTGRRGCAWAAALAVSCASFVTAIPSATPVDAIFDPCPFPSAKPAPPNAAQPSQYNAIVSSPSGCTPQWAADYFKESWDGTGSNSDPDNGRWVNGASVTMNPPGLEVGDASPQTVDVTFSSLHHWKSWNFPGWNPPFYEFVPMYNFKTFKSFPGFENWAERSKSPGGEWSSWYSNSNPEFAAFSMAPTIDCPVGADILESESCQYQITWNTRHPDLLALDWQILVPFTYLAYRNEGVNQYVAGGGTTWLMLNVKGRDTTPTAEFTVAPAGSPGAFHFVSTSTDPAGAPLNLSWDLDDGSTATAPSVDHRYTRPGTYSVTLTATNPSGLQSSVTHDVVVKAPTLTTQVTTPGRPNVPLDVGATATVRVTDRKSVV